MSMTGGTWAAKYSQGGVFENEIYVHRSSNPGGNRRDYTGECDIRHWDYAPPKEYFTELQRVSKNQIIWGGNYFDLPPTRCFIVWRKTNIPLKGFTMAPVEYAWASFNKNAAMFEYTSAGTLKEPRFHPTQKPVQLYQWTLDTFAEKGMRILDTHAGSASSLVACERMGFEYIGFELDKTYFRLASERLEAERSKPTLF